MVFREVFVRFLVLAEVAVSLLTDLEELEEVFLLGM